MSRHGPEAVTVWEGPARALKVSRLRSQDGSADTCPDAVPVLLRYPGAGLGRCPRCAASGRGEERREHVRVREALAPEAGLLECPAKGRPVVHPPVGSRSPESEGSIRPDDDRAGDVQNSSNFLQTCRQVVFRNVLEDVVHDDQVEGAVREWKLMERGDVQLRFRNAAARDVDRLGPQIDPRDMSEQARAGCPAQVASRPTPGIEQARAGLKASTEQCPLDGTGTPVPPTALVDDSYSLVVVEGNAGRYRGSLHPSKSIAVGTADPPLSDRFLFRSRIVIPRVDSRSHVPRPPASGADVRRVETCPPGPPPLR